MKTWDGYYRMIAPEDHEENDDIAELGFAGSAAWALGDSDPGMYIYIDKNGQEETSFFVLTPEKLREIYETIGEIVDLWEKDDR